MMGQNKTLSSMACQPLLTFNILTSVGISSTSPQRATTIMLAYLVYWCDVYATIRINFLKLSMRLFIFIATNHSPHLLFNSFPFQVKNGFPSKKNKSKVCMCLVRDELKKSWKLLFLYLFLHEVSKETNHHHVSVSFKFKLDINYVLGLKKQNKIYYSRDSKVL